MTALPAGARIELATNPVHFRERRTAWRCWQLRSWGDLFSTAVPVFRSRRVHRVQILVWDGSGLDLIGYWRWSDLMSSTG